MAFFSPHRGYMHGDEPGDQVRQFKEMVRELHAAGIEVILDVVFNHTAEGNEHGPTFSFKGLENSVYYMLNDDGSYKNYSGCGNTVNGNHPIVREMIFHCLRHWVHNYHIDGFRFDLASILSRNRNGELVPNPPLVELIAEDPMLADTKIIAEAWDAAGAFQVGSFANAALGRVERPLPRRHPPLLARRLRHDRPDGHAARRVERPLPAERPPAVPQHQLHHVARRLHAQRPGELRAEAQRGQRRGQPRRRQQQLQRQLRRRRPDAAQGDRRRSASGRSKNMMASLLLSQGVPMIVAGDEVLRTQRGNNNAYCQDNAISWFDWRLVERNAEMLRFVQALIAFRRQQPNVRRPTFLTGTADKPGQLPDVSWYGTDGKPVDWHNVFHSLTAVLRPQRARRPGRPAGDDHDARRRPAAAVRRAEGRVGPEVAAVRRHGGRIAGRRLSRRRRPAAAAVGPDPAGSPFAAVLCGGVMERGCRMQEQGAVEPATIAESIWAERSDQ